MALKQINGDEFERLMEQGALIVAAFWADWVDGSAELLETMEQLANKYADHDVVIGGMNVDNEGYFGIHMGLYYLPTVMIFQGGEEVDRMMGVSPLALYDRVLGAYFAPEDSDSPERSSPYEYDL